MFNFSIWFLRRPSPAGPDADPTRPGLEHRVSGQGTRRSSIASARHRACVHSARAIRLTHGARRPERQTAGLPRTRMRSSLTLPQSPGARSIPSSRPSSRAGTHPSGTPRVQPKQPLPPRQRALPTRSTETPAATRPRRSLARVCRGGAAGALAECLACGLEP